MDSGRNFGFSALLRMQTHENKHKVKPMQLISVAEGVKKRLESDIKNKRRTRLTNFDIFRNLPESEPPVQAPLNKIEKRRLQLQQWKEEKDKKKMEYLKMRKIPFVVGIPKNSKNFEPPPSMLLRPLPSTSGRVTRSQAARSNLTGNKTEKVYAFAPQNAVFNPSLEGLDKPTFKSTFGEKKYETHKKQSTKVKSPNNVLNQQPRCLRSKSKLNGESTAKQTQNELNAQKKTIPKSKTLAKQPLKDSKSTKSKIIFSSTTSSSSDDDTYTKETVVLKVTSVKKTKTSRKGRKTDNTTKKEDHSKSTASTKIERLVDLSNCSTSMETDGDKPSHSSEMLPDATVTPNKQNASIKDFITFTPKNPVPKSESSSEEKLRSPKATDVPMTPQQINEEVKKISPRVYLSRGKENTRKEMKKRIDEGLLDEDVCDMSVEHFQRQLDSEIKRITEMCEVWDKILEQTTIPDEIQEAVLAAVGQARLLMSQKLQQFASLLRRCERPEPGQALVTRVDLQGFWDMVFLQVENVDVRFKKLDQSRARGWVNEEPIAVAQRPKPPQPKPSQPKPTERALPAPSSRLKDIIAAARKAKQAAVDGTKTFEAGFFSVQSPVKSPAAATPRRKPSLLQSVLSSEAKKASAKKSSCAMMRVSLIGKNVDSADGEIYEANIVSLTPINLGLTPGKSILKSNNNTGAKVASKISFKLFNMDSASDSSPPSDDGQISGVEKLRDLDTSQNSSEPSPAKEQNLENSQSLEKSPKSQKLPNLESLQISDNTPNVEDNSVTINAEKLPEVKERRRSSRKIRESLHEAEDISELDTKKHVEEIGKRRSTRKLRASLHNAEENSVLDTGKQADEKENRRSRKLRGNLHNGEENLMTTDTEALGGEKENRRSSRRRAKLERQDAEENVTPVKTRSRSKTRQTPASENLANTRSSRRNKSLMEVNEEKSAVTPTSTRSRRRV